MELKRRTVLALTAALLLICYAPTLRGMSQQWWNDEDMGYGFLVPIVIAWILWRERSHWQNLASEPSPWGFALLALGASMHAAGAVGGGLFASSVAFLVSVAGAVACLSGFGLLRAWTFPFLLALFMLPKLAIVYDQGTLPLQLLASRLAAGVLTVSGIGVIREGDILDVGGRRVAVAEACSGIRYLLPLGFVALVFAYLSDPKPWMRLALLAAAIPVAIFANAVRVAGSAWVSALDSGAAHQVFGWVIFTLSLALLLPLPRLFNSAYARYHA